jgi:hypothetical protein
LTIVHPIIYAQIQRWLEDPDHTSALPQPLIEHISECAMCRGALLLLLIEALGGWPTDTISCAASQEQLAAYIDVELEAGTAQAWQRHPALVWHLLTCFDCAETYTLTRAMLEAQQSGTLAPPPFLSPPGRPQRWLLAALRLTRSFLQQSLPTRLAPLGAVRGVEPAWVLLYESEEAGHLLSLSVDSQSQASRTIAVDVEPPIDGRLTLTLDDFTREARFSGGRATIADVPASVLDSPAGPDLLALIECEPPANP